MSATLHPQVQPKAETQNQDHELASYGGWQEQEVQEVQQPAQSRAAAPLPLLDEDDRVTPEQVQQERPWLMRPTPRMIAAGGAVMALLYVLFSLFGLWGGSSTQQSPNTLTVMDPLSTNQEVEERLKQLQSENEELKREKLVGDPLPQATAQPPKGKPVEAKRLKSVADAPRAIAIPPRPRAAVAPPPPRPMYVSRSVAPSPISRPISRPVFSFAPRPLSTWPLASAITKPTATAKVEPKLSPQDQWLAAANMGHYVAAKGEDTAYGSEAQPAFYMCESQT